MYQVMQIVLETPRLVLRRFANSEADATLIFGLNSNPSVLQYLHERQLQSVEDASEILQKVILPQYENKLGRWAAHTKQDNQFIGWCGLKHRPEIDEIDLGYRLAPASWGKGYATEAATATLEYAFEILRLPCITSRSHVQNKASIAVLKKAGMKYVGDSVVDDCPVQVYEARHHSL